jgi:hypothetical protein
LTGNGPLKPGLIWKVVEPLAPVPVTRSGAARASGVIAIGTRACVPAPRRYSDPKSTSDKGAFFRLNLILIVLVCPAEVKFRMDGLTVALTPGRLIVAW